MNENEAAMEECPCCSGKHKNRDEKEFKDLMNRLKRIEGQVRGVENMLENGVYCTDILIQVSAINSALNSFNKVLLGNHLKTCVAENIRNGNDDIIDELVIKTDEAFSKSKLPDKVNMETVPQKNVPSLNLFVKSIICPSMNISQLSEVNCLL